MVVKIAFWIFVLTFDLMLPLLMLGLGKEFQKNPPREINPGYGYRTTRSMRSQAAWDFSQRRMGEVWNKWGRVLLLPSLVPMLFLLGRDVGLVGTVGMVICGVQLAVMLASIFVVERELKKHFDQNGIRKTETD